MAHLEGLPKSKPQELGPWGYNLTMMNGGSLNIWHLDSLFLGIRLYVTGKVFLFLSPHRAEGFVVAGCTFDRSSRIVKDSFLFKNPEGHETESLFSTSFDPIQNIILPYNLHVVAPENIVDFEKCDWYGINDGRHIRGLVLEEFGGRWSCRCIYLDTLH